MVASDARERLGAPHENTAGGWLVFLAWMAHRQTDCVMCVSTARALYVLVNQSVSPSQSVSHQLRPTPTERSIGLNKRRLPYTGGRPHLMPLRPRASWQNAAQRDVVAAVTRPEHSHVVLSVAGGNSSHPAVHRRALDLAKLLRAYLLRRAPAPRRALHHAPVAHAP